MSRRRLLRVVGALGFAATVGGVLWFYFSLAGYWPLDDGGGESGGTFYKHGIQYSTPLGAFGPDAGREIEVVPVGSGPAWLGFTIHNSGDYAVTITGLAEPSAGDPQGHLRITALLSPNGYQGDPNDGMPGLGNPVPFRPETIPAHQYRWIGFRFATTNCDGITGSKRFVIGRIGLRIDYARFFDATDVVNPPWVAVATCGPFHPVLYP